MAGPRESAGRPSAVVSEAYLRVVAGPREGVQVPLVVGKPIVIGRKRGELLLDDPMVSSAHCQLLLKDGEVLLLESKVPPHLIDRVHSGLPVDVRFAAFADSPQLVVDGRLVSVSGDLLTEPQTNAQYYLARVELTQDGYRKLGARSLQPGMPVEVVLRTGERSLLTYLLHPLTKRLAASMKED